jgi:hypothetical protein
MNKEMTDKTNACKQDFYLMLEEAYKRAGGGIPFESIKDMSFDDAVGILAPNGIRMLYVNDRLITDLQQKTTWAFSKNYVKNPCCKIPVSGGGVGSFGVPQEKVVRW